MKTSFVTALILLLSSCSHHSNVEQRVAQASSGELDGVRLEVIENLQGKKAALESRRALLSAKEEEIDNQIDQMCLEAQLDCEKLQQSIEDAREGIFHIILLHNAGSLTYGVGAVLFMGFLAARDFPVFGITKDVASSAKHELSLLKLDMSRLSQMLRRGEISKIAYKTEMISSLSNSRYNNLSQVIGSSKEEVKSIADLTTRFNSVIKPARIRLARIRRGGVGGLVTMVAGGLTAIVATYAIDSSENSQLEELREKRAELLESIVDLKVEVDTIDLEIGAINKNIELLEN